MFKLVVLLSVAAMAAAKPGVVAPVVYSSVVPASSSVSEYSTSIVHGSPALYRAPAVVSAPVVLNAPVYSARAVVPAVAALSQAPYQPAIVLDAVNGVPLDTPEVVAARAAHYRAKALGPFHRLRKRSIGVAPLSYGAVVSPISYSRPLVSNYPVGPVALSAPLGYSSVYPRAYSWHPY
ncbi:unnamed protein product [Arctia plantaginis]|uniref:Cuticle protein n=1 Tax=Arctia plantaginis TaxID=874455 RepID=A0A8S1BIF4_ARCPL|nr:unnamed protein product [Arctia plantaginis]CAB3259822.1 unnamed protein product [Arctia plantaginis]